MNRKIKRFFSIVLVACMLLPLVPLQATSLNEEEDLLSNELVMDDELLTDNNAEESNTEFSLSSEQGISSSIISEEIIEELKTSENKKPNSNIIEDERYIQTYSTNKLTNDEIDMSGWRLSLAIQDNINRWTDNVDWKADNDYSEEKVIKYQITYENDSIPQEYAPGDLSIVIPRIERIINPTYPIYEKHHENGSTSTVYSYFEINIAADNKSDSIKKFDWSYEIIDENYVFTNNNVIDNSSLQGTIQLSYGIKARELPNNTDFSVNAVMNNSIESNSVSFKFNATERTANSSIIAKKLTYNDKYSKDFIYILYNYEISTYDGMGFLPINTHSIKMDLDLPNGCKIYDTLLNELNKIDGYYSLDKTSYENYDNKNRIIYSAIIAYPIELYTDKVIKSNIKFFAEHKNIGIYVPTEEDYCINNIKLVASSEININTADFYFNYTGTDIGITKRNANYYKDGGCSLDYTNITTNSESSEWAINGQVTGISDCSIRLGDDCLIAQNQDGEYVFLNDDEYYISLIKLPRIYNQNDIGYVDSTVNIDVYVRYEGEDEYVFYTTVKNGKYNGVTFSRERKNIVGFYIELKNLTNGLKTTEASYGLRPQIVIKKSDIANNSRIYNFAYIQVFDKNGNIINVPDITNYDGSCLSYGIPQKDLDNYGK